MKRGEVWWAHLPAPAGRRPVLLLSRDSMPAGHGEITVAYLTSSIRQRPVEVLLTPRDGVRKTCVVNLSRSAEVFSQDRLQPELLGEGAGCV